MAVSLASDFRFAIYNFYFYHPGYPGYSGFSGYSGSSGSSKEQIRNPDRSDNPGEICQESAGDGMAGLADTYAAEVYGEDVEGRVRRPLEDTTQASYERIGTVGRHRIDHHTAGSATRERLHQCRRQGSHEVGVATAGLNTVFDTVDEHVHRSGGAEHGDGHEDGNQIGDDSDGRGETILSPLDEGIVDVHFLPHTSQDEGDDDQHQQDICCRGADTVHQHGVHLPEAPDDCGYDQCRSAQSQQQRTVQQVDLLEQAGDDDACQGREERGQQDGNEYVRRLCRSHLRAVHKDGDGDQRQARGIQHEEHDHWVRRRVLLRVQFLQLLHGFQTERGGGIVQP